MPAQVNISEAVAAPTIDEGIDFRVVVVGFTSAQAWPSDKVSPLYGNPAALANDAGISDAVDVGTDGLVRTRGNPGPPALAVYSTPATTHGVRGTIDTSGVNGSATVNNTAVMYPKGTYEPKVFVVDDGNNGAGGLVGSAGIVLQASLDNGRTRLPTVQLGTDTTFEIEVGGVGTGVMYDLSNGDSLFTDDSWLESKTVPPMWDSSDLYDATDPLHPTGALPAIGANALHFGEIWLTEPIADGDFSVIVAGLDHLLTKYGQKPLLVCRFRDRDPGESDGDHVAAFQTFAASHKDDRICIMFGSGWVSDALRGYRYLRSGMGPVLARVQSFAIKPEERLAHHPGFGGDGPLERFTLVDDNGDLIADAHDEFERGGIDGPINSGGGGMTFCYQRADGIVGTYVSEAPVLYPALGTVLTLMDRCVVSGIERVMERQQIIEAQLQTISERLLRLEQHLGDQQ